jgi:ubiquinone/menaquinone biosynthesis C-methylase UbiE
MLATEKRSLERATSAVPVSSDRAEAVIRRLSAITPLPASLDILGLGAAQGLFLIWCAKNGHRAVGVDPSPEARATGTELASRFGVEIALIDGVAEKIQFADASFDLVYAASVIEHVDDANAAFREAFRVLRPGGVFWFYTASSMCPLQAEIRGFPAFGWYPNPLNLQVMRWASLRRPELIGHTSRPAIHWFTPWKARRMLNRAGFRTVFDRWDLRLPSEGPMWYRLALGTVCAAAQRRKCSPTSLFRAARTQQSSSAD